MFVGEMQGALASVNKWLGLRCRFGSEVEIGCGSKKVGLAPAKKMVKSLGILKKRPTPPTISSAAVKSSSTGIV